MPLFSKPVVSKSRYRVHFLVALALLLLSRTRLSALPRLKRINPLLPDKAKPDEVKKARQQLYVDEQDGSKSLLVPFRNSISKVCPLLRAE